MARLCWVAACAVLALLCCCSTGVHGADAGPPCTIEIVPIRNRPPWVVPGPLNLMEIGLYVSSNPGQLPDWTYKGRDYLDVVALGGNYSLSSTWPGYPITNCFDGDANTMCASDNKDAAPKLTINLPPSLCDKAVFNRLAVKIVNRPNGPRCATCADRVLNYKLIAADADGSVPFPIVFALMSPRGLPTYTLYPGGYCAASIQYIGGVPPLQDSAADRFLNIDELVLQTDFTSASGKPNAVLSLQDVTAGMTSTFTATGAWYGVENCFDGRQGSFCSTAYNDPNPYLVAYYPCHGGKRLTVAKINNRPSSKACRSCQSRIAPYTFVVVDSQTNPGTDTYSMFSLSSSLLSYEFVL